MDLFKTFYDQKYPNEAERDYKNLPNRTMGLLLLPFIEWVNENCTKTSNWDGPLQEDEGARAYYNSNEMGH